jgi:UPF0755 protein
VTRRWLPWVIIASFSVLILSGFLIMLWITSPVVRTSTGTPPPIQIVEIPDGATFRQVAALLQQEHVIPSRLGFLLLGRLTLADRHIIPGEYALHGGMAPREILAKLLSGQVVLHPVTIPEGFTVAQIAALLEEKGLTNAKEFLARAQDREFIISAFHLDLPNLEGYLFPDTYHFSRHAKAKEMITTMMDRFWQTFTPEWRRRADDIHMTMHQVLTLASVIEKETGADGERELIASVFHNRLSKHIPLQSDPTVIYGMTSFDGNLRRRDLEKTTPYNTYRVVGLPPGPIANPGAHSIRATLYPASTTFLYFVSKNNGTHQFSSTLTEHNLAVDRYQRRHSKRAS